MKIYAFTYNSCIYESADAVMSLHYSKKGAEKAMNKHKEKELKKFNDTFAVDNEFDIKFGEHENWSVSEFKIYP